MKQRIVLVVLAVDQFLVEAKQLGNHVDVVVLDGTDDDVRQQVAHENSDLVFGLYIVL